MNEANKTKKHSHFQERRFAKLGYTASTILYHLEEYQAVLQKTKSNNQLVQACRVYLECEFIILGLKVLSWFTYKITLPFLNMVEQASQSDLLTILPQLYNDLVDGNLDTLKEYHVSYSFDPEEPESVVGQHILSAFSKRAASDLATQRGREYGFGTQAGVSSRATILNTLSAADLVGLPTNNLDCERDLAKFDKLAARSAACSNRKFTATGIRDDMTVYKSDHVTIHKVTSNIEKVLDERERRWMEEQKILTKDRLQRACDSALKAEEYTHVLLHKCKSWGGPFTSITELEEYVLQSQDDETLKATLRSEVGYRRHTSPRDFQTRPNLYKLNQVSAAELKMNLTILLTTEAENMQAVQDMPTEDDMIKIFQLHADKPSDEKTTTESSETSDTQHAPASDPEVTVIMSHV